MRLPDALRSGAFRFALLMAAVFAIGAAALLVVLEREVSQYAAEVARDGVAAEVAVLRDEDRSAGRAEAVRTIARRETVSREHQLRYLLVDRTGRRLAGALPASAAHLGWRVIRIANDQIDDDNTARTLDLDALGVRLEDGATLVVASDRSDLAELRGGLVTSAAVFGGGVILCALFGGLAVGTLFLRRLAEVNRAVHRIVEGDVSRRLPAIGMSPEFDDLSAHLNRMLDRIEALMEGVRQVSTDIAHDLRTPLSRLRQRLETLRESLPDAGSREAVDGAIGEADRILAIFAALLRISALEAGAARGRMVAASLSEIMERVFQAYLPVAEDSGHGLSADIAPGVEAAIDADMMTQAVSNLVENAVFHTPPGGTIVIGLQRAPEGIVISVADNGPGIPADERDKVLGRFYRLEGSAPTSGAGLGLAMVAAVSAIHGADLRLRDNRPGLVIELVLPPPRRR